MNEKEFKQQLRAEMKADAPDSQPEKVAQAITSRQSRKGKGQKKILNARNLAIFGTFAAALVVVFSIAFWPKGGIDTIHLDADTPYQTVTTFEQIKERVGNDVKLPIGFDEGYTIKEMKVYYPEENKPCAIEINYRKYITEYQYVQIEVTILLADNVVFDDESRYAACNMQGAANGINYMYSLKENEQEIVCLAKFKANDKDYLYEAYATDEQMLITFIQSLE